MWVLGPSGMYQYGLESRLGPERSYDIMTLRSMYRLGAPGHFGKERKPITCRQTGLLLRNLK